MVCQGSPDVPPTRQKLLGGVRESSAGNQPNLPNGLTCWCGVRYGDPGLPVTLATSRCPSSPYPSPEGWCARSNSDTVTCLDRVSWQMVPPPRDQHIAMRSWPSPQHNGPRGAKLPGRRRPVDPSQQSLMFFREGVQEPFGRMLGGRVGFPRF